MSIRQVLIALATACVLVINGAAAGEDPPTPPPLPPGPKIGVIMHDHGAPREHNAESYYGMKYFLHHLMGMGAIPMFLMGWSFDPLMGDRGSILMDRTYPNTEVAWADLELTDAWGRDWTWLKYVDVDGNTPEQDLVYEWFPDTDNWNYGGVGAYLVRRDLWGTVIPWLPGFGERDWFEFVGHDFRYKWMLKGGPEVYFTQVGEQRERIRDALWQGHKKQLTGSWWTNDVYKEDFIRITWGIDPFFPNTDPTASIHAQSLYDAVYGLVADLGVDTIVVNEYFMFLSRMMNDGMDRETVPLAVADLVNDGYAAPTIIWAPEKIEIGEATNVPIVTGCVQEPPWDPSFGPVISGYESKMMHVGGTALDDGYLEAVVDKVQLELAKLGATTGDVVMLMSNHGTPTQFSHCWDSANDYIHYSYKLVFTRIARKIATRLGIPEPVFGPQSPGAVYGDDLLDIAILSRNIQYATLNLTDGRELRLYRVSGQESGPEDDVAELTYTPREVLEELVVLNTGGASYNDVVDLLYNFMGDSGDLLWDHRFDGYGHEDEHDPLAWTAYEYCNPEVDPGELNYAIQNCALPQFAGLEPYESDFTWNGIHVRITNATWAFPEKEAAVGGIIGAAIDAATAP